MTAEELRIDSIAAGGDGVARANGMVVFVPRTAPGDEALVEVTAKGRFARGVLRGLPRPSARRTTPRCAHYVNDRCGGCQLQHIEYDAQLEAKGRIIADAMQRIGKRPIGSPPVVPSPKQWRYRRKLSLALRRRGSRWIAGLHPFDRPSHVFALEDCPITEEAVLAVWRAVLGAAALLPTGAERGSVLVRGEQVALVIEGGERWPTARRFFEHLPALGELWWKPAGHGVRLVRSRVDSASGASFAQVNAAMAAQLEDEVLARVVAHAPRTVIDAYAGVGDVAARLAERGIGVTAIELDPRAAERCAARLPPGSRSFAGAVEERLPEALPADVVLLNPPRSGLDARVTDALEVAPGRPKAIVYVSCNPATLARDVGRLPSFAVASVQGFDMFPQTAHVETLCELVREPM